jgi:8-oxo-dGTP diphosphatase
VTPGAAPRPEVAVGAVAVDEGALLLVRRGRPPEAGRWSVPGGRVERGEPVGAAVEREVLEETGATVRCGPFLGWVERIAPDHHFVILDFLVDVLRRGDRPGGDALEVTWVPLAEVHAVDLVTGLEEFLRAHGVV